MTEFSFAPGPFIFSSSSFIPTSPFLSVKQFFTSWFVQIFQLELFAVYFPWKKTMYFSGVSSSSLSHSPSSVYHSLSFHFLPRVSFWLHLNDPLESHFLPSLTYISLVVSSHSSLLPLCTVIPLSFSLLPPFSLPSQRCQGRGRWRLYMYWTNPQRHMHTSS